MSKHTPGPWVADNGEGYGEADIWRIQPPIGSNVKIVAEMICDSAEAEANARLIAAAPELLEALRLFLAYNDQGAPLSFDTDAMWAKARSVVAKIEGGEA